MGKFENHTPVKKVKKSKKPQAGIVLVVVLAVTLAALLMMFVIPQLLYRLGGEAEPDFPEAETLPQELASEPETTEATEPEEEESLPLQEALQFPAVLENGNLTIDNLFSYSGILPDNGGEDTGNTAAILLQNTSGQYLQSATVTATLQDGTLCTFCVTDIPAGRSITAFAAGSEPLAQDDFCTTLSCEAVFEDVTIPEQLTVTAAGMEIIVENTSAEDLTNIDIYCRDILGESYFGSTIYKHTIENLSAGQTTTITVSDSFVGLVDVVRIAINES